jgi:ATP-dependent Clp protease ATP-binding subunit ClpA
MYERFLSCLSEEGIGQPEAVRAFARAAVRALTPLAHGRRPAGVLLIAGPTGSGKRHLTRALARLVLGDENRVIELNPAFHSTAGPFLRYLHFACAAHDAFWPGPPPPVRIVIIQGFERCNAEFLELFIHVFATGEVATAPGVALDFRRTVFVLETDVAARAIEDLLSPAVGFHVPEAEARARIDERIHRQIDESVHAAFGARFLSLVDEVVHFRRIWEPDLEYVLDNMIRRLQRSLAPLGVLLHVDRTTRQFLLLEGRARLRHGAMGLQHVVDRALAVPLMDLLLDARLPPGSAVYVRKSLDGIALYVPADGMARARALP